MWQSHCDALRVVFSDVDNYRAWFRILGIYVCLAYGRGLMPRVANLFLMRDLVRVGFAKAFAARGAFEYLAKLNARRR